MTERGRPAVVRAAYLEAVEGQSLGLPGHDAVVSLELTVDEGTGHLAAYAVRLRGEAGAIGAGSYSASWGEAQGEVPEWALEWARKLGMR